VRVYRGGLTDSERWDGFAFRPDDVVISTPSKCGTTWLQMICALLILQQTDLPAPLTELSPWLDMRLRPIEKVRRRLDAQRHRRFIKTHTPLDGLPSAPGVTFLVCGRDPRDAAISMDHHRENLDGETINRLLQASDGSLQERATAPKLDHRSRVLRWIEIDDSPETNLSSLRGTTWHLNGAWTRRHDPDVILVHYADLSTDLEAQMRMIAGRLGITVPADRWPALTEAATFSRMRANADTTAPDERVGLLTDRGRFFHAGTSGQWQSLLTPDDLHRYGDRLGTLAPADLISWMHHREMGLA
jgi:hypothetical protein